MDRPGGHYHDGREPALMLRAAEAEIALGAEYIAVEVCDPLPSARRHIQIADGALDMRRNAVPVKLRIQVGEIGGRGIAELAVHADLFEFEIQRIGLA